jgi:hypothetical protein
MASSTTRPGFAEIGKAQSPWTVSRNTTAAMTKIGG